MLLSVLYEDNHCLAVNKPAGLLVQDDQTGDTTLLDLAKGYLKEQYRKPGNVYLGLVHRLDRPVSGVVLLARTSKAAGRLSEQFRTGAVQKVYRALVEGTCADDEGVWTDRLAKDQTRNVSRSLSPGEPGGKLSELAFHVIARYPGRTLLELRPLSGRSHQIRVQLASRGLPILGDRRYGAKSWLQASDGLHRIGLHAKALRFTHPTREEEIWVDAPEPADWPAA